MQRLKARVPCTFASITGSSKNPSGMASADVDGFLSTQKIIMKPGVLTRARHFFFKLGQTTTSVKMSTYTMYTIDNSQDV